MKYSNLAMEPGFRRARTLDDFMAMTRTLNRPRRCLSRYYKIAKRRVARGR